MVKRIARALIAPGLLLCVGTAQAQRPAICDSTIMVDERLTHNFDVRDKLGDWLPDGTAVQLLFQPPEIQNKNMIGRALVRSYPSYLRDRGIGGTVYFALFVDTTGVVSKRRLLLTSTLPDLDKAAESVVMQFRFAPARLDAGCAVPILVPIPVVFKTLP
jgi:TonB family protein